MKRLLIVEDEPLIISTIKRLFKDYEVFAFEDGCEAIMKLVDSRIDIDCVICDFLLPNCNGKDVYDAIRDSRPELLKKVIFLTGGTNIPGVANFLEETDCPRLDKPFSLNELRRMVESIARDTEPAPPPTDPPPSS